MSFPRSRYILHGYINSQLSYSSIFVEVLNVSGNNLDSLVELNNLEKLQELTASNNHLENIRELIQLLTIWPRMKRLDTSRNPFCSKARYRERLIVVSTTLEMLDGKQITDNSRKFLMSWKASREAQQTREKSKVDASDGLGDYHPSFGVGGGNGGKLFLFLP